MPFLTGVLAALSAPLAMAVGFVVWDNHWTGSPFALNLYKCNLAAVGFVVLSWATRPFSSEVFRWDSVGYLVLSSAVGILVGDLAWLEGLRLLGARRVIVMDSLKPFLAAVFGWAFLGERLRPAALGGIVLTVLGILLVGLEADQQEPEPETEEDVTKEKDGFVDAITSPAKGKLLKADLEASTQTLATAQGGDPSSLSIGTGGGQHSSTNLLPVVVDQDEEEAGETQVQEVVKGGDEDDNNPQQPRQSLTNTDKRAQTRQQFFKGYTLSIINVVLDTYGSVLTKEHGANFTTWEINLVRFGFAGLVMGVCSTVLVVRDRLVIAKDTNSDSNGGRMEGNNKQPVQLSEEEETAIHGTQEAWYGLPIATMSRSAWARVSLGVLFVTFFAPALSNYALFQVALALALTLGSVGPLYALPLTYLMQRKEHAQLPSPRVWLGALLAVAGIVVLAFWGTLE